MAAFSTLYGVRSNNLAEFFATKEGFELCITLGIEEVTMESDSMIVVYSLKLRKIEECVLDCLHLLRASLQIHHIIRQRNRVADCLTDWAHTHKRCIEIYRIHDLPPAVNVAFTKDRYGLWDF